MVGIEQLRMCFCKNIEPKVPHVARAGAHGVFQARLLRKKKKKDRLQPGAYL